MSPIKTHMYFDLDNGRPTIQQITRKNDIYCDETCVSSFQTISTSFTGHVTDLVPSNNTSGNHRDYSSSSSDSWETNDMIQRESRGGQSCYTYSPVSLCMNNEEMINLGVCSKEVQLILKTPPEHRFRYRYDTEMSGTHGSLQGIRSGIEKSVPEVELINYPHEALIRVSLVTCNDIGERYPHPHNLFVKEKMYQKKIYESLHNKPLTKTGHYSDPHYIRVGVNGVDYVARFEGMCIISSKKENFSAFIKEKLQSKEVEHNVRLMEKEDFSKKVDEAVKLVDLDFVSLCFEAFREDKEGRLIPLCAPLYSLPIGNAKSANTGKLKISRINKCSGSCKGGDEIWLLVEKINKKGLVIRFFEECDGKMLWESCIEGDDIILHHQYAIIFKTPPYRDPNISTEVKVLMRLERSTQLSQACNFSEPITFVYEPQKNRSLRSENLYKKESILSQNKLAHIKRPRTESSVIPTINFQYKRKKDEEECANLMFDEADFDNIFSDNGLDSAHLGQFLPPFNVEDFLQFFSDDSDISLQKDGISSSLKSRRDLIQILHFVYSKYDENEVKKLTDRINNIKFSKRKGKAENGSNEEKEDVEEAVSTLLSLSERAVEINKLKKEVEKGNYGNLYKAVLENKPEVVRRMMETTSLRQDDDCNTPLHLSLLLSNDSCTENILLSFREMKNNINVKNKEGKTSLHLAAANGNLQFIKLLIECGANVNEIETKTKRNALHIAVVERHPDVAEYLVENTEIRLNDLDSDGQSPLTLAKLLLPAERANFEKIFKPKEIKKEKSKESKVDVRSNNKINLDKLYDTLNETGSWRVLADMWNCSYIISSAEETENPAKCIFNCSEELNGEIELDALRNLLDVINEKQGLIILDEILARKFLYSK